MESRFSGSQVPRPMPVPSNRSRDGTFAGSPLYGNGDFRDVNLGLYGTSIQIILHEMWSLTVQALSSSQKVPHTASNRPRQCQADSFACFAHNEQPSVSIMSVPSDFGVHKAIYHAALIYGRALSYPETPFKSMVNHSDLRSLYEAINISGAENFWLDFPGILLWVLVVACAVAVDKEERSYFMMFLAKVGIFTEPRCWVETQTAFARFIQVQGLTRRHVP